MIEPAHYDTSRAWSWRHAVGKSGLPPTTRLVLHTLGLKMDATGGSCFPPISELVELTGLDKKTVLKHLDIAEEKGWIEIGQHGYRGQKWKRNEYVARWPGRDLVGDTASMHDAEGGGTTPPPCRTKLVELVPEGGGIDAMKVVEPLPQDKILPANIPATSPAASAEGGGISKSDRKKSEVAFTLWYATWKKGDVDYARNAWFALSADERAECIDKTPAYLRWAKPSDLMAAAVYLKNRHWRDIPEVGNAPVAIGVAKFCGKLWVGTRLEALSHEPTGRVVITQFDRHEISSGRTTEAALLRSKRLEQGWPVVTTMRDLARRHEPLITSFALLPHVADFKQVEKGTALFLAWADLHERHGWPFIENPQQYVWFPPVDLEAHDDLDSAVEAALELYISAINEGRGHDDAA